jgi:hypothetical protein
LRGTTIVVWAGVAVFAIGLVLMAVVEARDPADDEERLLPTLAVSAGAVVALVGGIFRGALSYVTSEGAQWQLGRTPKERLHRVATALSIAMIGIGIVLGTAAIPLSVVLLDDVDAALAVSLAALLVPIALALLGSAIAGAVIMGGPRAAWVGVVFGVGFALLILGIVTLQWLWAGLGVAALGVSGAAFYAIGARAGAVPAAYARRFSRPATLILGVVIALVGAATGGWPLLLFGAMMVAAFVGMRIGTAGAREDAQHPPSTARRDGTAADRR